MPERSHSNVARPLETWRQGVTIGVPLYNEELFIEAAIRSAAHQCEVLLVADNHSTDESAEICHRLALEYPHLVFIRHPRNLGAASNFKFVMSQARTPYFMWLGAHDLIPSDYVRQLRAVLDAHSTATLAFGAATHIDRNGKEVSRYDYPFSKLLADEMSATRLLAIIRYLHDCSLIHGLFRAEGIRAALVDDYQYLGSDHVLLARSALAGKFMYTPATALLRRDVHISDSPSRQLERITGVSRQKLLRSRYQRMQRSQFELATQVSKSLGWRARLYKLAARYWLTFRYGPFSNGIVAQLMEGAIWLSLVPRKGFQRTLGWWSKCSAWFSRISDARR